MRKIIHIDHASIFIRFCFNGPRLMSVMIVVTSSSRILLSAHQDQMSTRFLQIFFLVVHCTSPYFTFCHSVARDSPCLLSRPTASRAKHPSNLPPPARELPASPPPPRPILPAASTPLTPRRPRPRASLAARPPAPRRPCSPPPGTGRGGTPERLLGGGLRRPRWTGAGMATVPPRRPRLEMDTCTTALMDDQWE